MKKTPSHFEYQDGMKIRVFDDPPGDPPGDERVIWAAKVVCGCALGTLVLLLLSLLSGCANADRVLWDLLGRIQTP